MAIAPEDEAVDLSVVGHVKSPVRRPLAQITRLDPTRLAYLIGPIAFVTLLLLMHFGYIAGESAWVWLSALFQRHGERDRGPLL